jgi:hypothetical protein
VIFVAWAPVLAGDQILEAIEHRMPMQWRDIRFGLVRYLASRDIIIDPIPATIRYLPASAKHPHPAMVARSACPMSRSLVFTIWRLSVSQPSTLLTCSTMAQAKRQSRRTSSVKR